MDEQVVGIFEKILSGISALACISVMILYMIGKSLRNNAFKTVFWLNLSNFFRSVALMTPSSINESSNISCTIIGYIFYSFSLSSLLLIFFIATKLYQSAFHDGDNNEQSDSKFNLSLFLIFAISFCICILPFFFDAYGPSIGVCGVKLSFIGNMFRFILYFGPATIITVYCCIVYTKVFRKLKENTFFAQDNLVRLKYFPLILIICFVPEIFVRILEFFGIFNYISYFVGSFLIRLIGFFDALAYAFTPPAKLFLKNLFTRNMKFDINQSQSFT